MIEMTEFTLNIDRFEDLSYEGDVIIELPRHFSLLPHDEKVAALDSPKRHRLIVAVGVDDNVVTIVTGKGKIQEVKKNLPAGRAAPTDGGKSVFFVDAGITISSEDIISEQQLHNV